MATFAALPSGTVAEALAQVLLERAFLSVLVDGEITKSCLMLARELNSSVL